jgi:dipeptidyl aminopeptidase/acylaminoacyl peptidase
VFSRCNVEFGFTAYCDIARIDADGSHRRTLVAGNWVHERPRYSPDGRKLAFSSNKGGFQGAVWTATADGGQLRRLTAPAREGFWPDWSPDGRRIAFASNLGGDVRLYTINRDGSDRRLVFDDQPGFADVFPGCTPDGRLVFQRCLPDDGVCAIYSVGLDGAGPRALTQFKPGANEANDFWPTVAPDGRIAFGRFGAGGSPPRCTSWARPGPAPTRSPRRRSWPSRGSGCPTVASW